MKYYEVTAPGEGVLKNFKSRGKAEEFAQHERNCRMKDLRKKKTYTQGEIKGETVYRTHGIIVREKDLEFSDDEPLRDDTDMSGANTLRKEPWGNLALTNQFPNRI